MAKMKRPIGDMVSGKIGNVVFITMRGKAYVRAAPIRKTNNWSEHQIMVRQRMKKIAALWRNLRSEPIKKIWNQFTDEMNGYALFIKHNMYTLSINGELIDPTQLIVSVGKLSPLLFLKAERETIDSDRIKVSWQNDPNLKKERLTDALFAVSMRDEKFSKMHDTGLKRGDQSGTFILPLPYSLSEGKVNLFLFLVSADEANCSMSESFGI